MASLPEGKSQDVHSIYAATYVHNTDKEVLHLPK